MAVMKVIQTAVLKVVLMAVRMEPQKVARKGYQTAVRTESQRAVQMVCAQSKAVQMAVLMDSQRVVQMVFQKAVQKAA